MPRLTPGKQVSLTGTLAPSNSFPLNLARLWRGARNPMCPGTASPKAPRKACTALILLGLKLPRTSGADDAKGIWEEQGPRQELPHPSPPPPALLPERQLTWWVSCALNGGAGGADGGGGGRRRRRGGCRLGPLCGGGPGAWPGRGALFRPGLCPPAAGDKVQSGAAVPGRAEGSPCLPPGAAPRGDVGGPSPELPRQPPASPHGWEGEAGRGAHSCRLPLPRHTKGREHRAGTTELPVCSQREEPGKGMRRTPGGVSTTSGTASPSVHFPVRTFSFWDAETGEKAG